MIHIIISYTSDKPIYQQLFDQISAQILKQELPAEYGLPPIRTIAKELRVSIITVKKAWELLEKEGFIYTVVGRGCFVAPLTSRELSGKKSELAEKKLLADIRYYKELGFSEEELIEKIREMYSR